MSSPGNPSRPDGLRRRQVLHGSVAVAGTAAAAALLAACGDDSTATPSSTTSPPPADPAPGATSPAGTVVAAADVPVGGGTITTVGDRKVVVTQPEAGTFVGFSAVCPHQGCSVGSVEADAIICPCHNSRFDPRTGAVLQGPAAAPLGAIPVAQQGDDIVFA